MGAAAPKPPLTIYPHSELWGILANRVSECALPARRSVPYGNNPQAYGQGYGRVREQAGQVLGEEHYLARRQVGQRRRLLEHNHPPSEEEA